MVAIAAEGHNVHLEFRPKLAEDWKNAISAGVNLEAGNYQYLTKRVFDSMNASQLESKIWLVFLTHFVDGNVSTGKTLIFLKFL